MKIELTKEETLVLYDFLHRISDNDILFAHPAEQCVLWNIECQLEKELIEPFLPNYFEIIKQARELVMKNY